MNQTINPRVFFAIVALVVVLGGVFAYWVWTRPSATAEAGAQAGGPATPGMSMSEPRGPSPDQLKQIQEWKKNNPGANTRY